MIVRMKYLIIYILFCSERSLNGTPRTCSKRDIDRSLKYRPFSKRDMLRMFLGFPLKANDV